MAIDVAAEAIIHRSRQDVARYATDPDHEPVWIGGILRSRMLTPPPLALDTEVERVAAFLGRRIEYALKVVEYEPDRRLVMHSTRGPFPMHVTYTFEETVGGTLVRIRIQGETAGFYGIAAPIMAGAVKRGITRDLKNLKDTLERQPAMNR